MAALEPMKTAGGGRRPWARALSLGTTMAAGMLLFTLAGWYADRRRGKGIFWTVAGMCLGLAYGGYEVWKAARDLTQPDGAEERRPRGPEQR
jgi:F0F1-type ATP synthase assembly protein I